MQNTTNYGLNKPEVTDFYNVDDFNSNMDIIDEKLKEADDNASGAKNVVNEHTENKENPHEVTKTQVGLSNVPNVSTNNQTPTYSISEEVTALTSGEKLSTAFGKIAKAISSLISHLGDAVSHVTSTERATWNGKADSVHQHTKFEITDFPTSMTPTAHSHTKSEITDFPSSMPASDVPAWAKASAKPSYTWDEITSKPSSYTPATHSHDKSEVGLGNVPNVATNDQTPTYTDITSLSTLTSGEKLSVAFQKIKLAITTLINHTANKSNPHGVSASQLGITVINNTADANKSVKYAASAGSATKATQDASGNNIADTYATKASLGVQFTMVVNGDEVDFYTKTS